MAHLKSCSSSFMDILYVIFTSSIIQKITISLPWNKWLFFTFSCGLGGRGGCQRKLLTWRHSQHTNTPLPTLITPIKHKETKKQEIMILTPRGRQCQERETEADSVPRMHSSEPIHHLYCLSYLSWVSIWNSKNPNTKTQDVHLPSRQHTSLDFFRRLEGHSGIAQWRILSRWLE